MAFSPALMDVKGFSIDTITICYAVLNINDTNNNIDFLISDDSTNYLAVIPVGNYNIDQLVSEIATQMTAAIHANYPACSFTVTKDAILWNIIITFHSDGTGGANFMLKFGSGFHHTMSLAHIIGFNLVNTSYTPSHRSDNYYHLSPPKTLRLKSTALSSLQKNPNFDGSSRTNTICVIPTYGSSGNTISFIPSPLASYDFLKSTDISSIDMSLCDDDDNPLNLNEDYTISLILRS